MIGSTRGTTPGNVLRGSGSAPVARSGMTTTSRRTTVWTNSDSGTVYHLRLPTRTDGSLTSPNRSRGM